MARRRSPRRSRREMYRRPILYFWGDDYESSDILLSDSTPGFEAAYADLVSRIGKPTGHVYLNPRREADPLDRARQRYAALKMMADPERGASPGEQAMARRQMAKLEEKWGKDRLKPRRSPWEDLEEMLRRAQQEAGRREAQGGWGRREREERQHRREAQEEERRRQEEERRRREAADARARQEEEEDRRRWEARQAAREANRRAAEERARQARERRARERRTEREMREDAEFHARATAPPPRRERSARSMDKKARRAEYRAKYGSDWHTRTDVKDCFKRKIPARDCTAR